MHGKGSASSLAGCSGLNMELAYGAKASGADPGCSTGGTVQHGTACNITLAGHTCNAGNSSPNLTPRETRMSEGGKNVIGYHRMPQDRSADFA